MDNTFYQRVKERRSSWITLALILLLLSQDLLWTIIEAIICVFSIDVDMDFLSPYIFMARCLFGFMYLLTTTLTNLASRIVAVHLLYRPVIRRVISALVIGFYLVPCIAGLISDSEHSAEIEENFLHKSKAVKDLPDLTRIIYAFGFLLILTIVLIIMSPSSIRRVITESYALLTALVGFALYAQGLSER